MVIEHVLVVEDSVTQAYAVRSQLEEAGYRVTVCVDGVSALERVQAGDAGVDAVVSDIVMPGLNGYELCSRLKTDPKLAAIPVLLLTALRDPLDVVHALEAGADGFLIKPVPGDQLTGRLGALLEGRGREADARVTHGLDVSFMGHRVQVNAGRQQVVDVLMSSFEELIRTNRVLAQREGELASAQVEVEHHVAEAEQTRWRLQRSLRLSGVGAWEFDLDGERLVWTQHVDELYGLAPGQLDHELGDLFEHIHPDDRDRVRRLIADARDQTGEGPSPVEEFEYRVVHPGGQVRWLRLRYTVTAERRLVGVALDATEEVALAQAATAARDEAEAANQAKNRFLTRMSHELRTPLNAILGFGQLLEHAEALDVDDRESVRHILDAGRHLLGLIDEVSDISRIESGDTALALEIVDVGEVVRQGLEMVRGLAANHQVTTRIGWGGPTFVTADRRRFQQIVINLLSNAVKYNRPGGQVEVHWERAADHVAIAVHDTGVGIAPEQLDRLFVPFDRLDADITAVEGTGLGLALTAHLVELHHGQVEVSSEPGVGSVFTVTLPAADEPVDDEPVDDEPPRRDRPPAVGSASGTVLYIEDSPSNVELVRQALARHPTVQLLDAPDGRTGLALVHAHRPDLVLLDLQLPGGSGRDVLTELRADPPTADVPVVVVTGDLSAGHPDQLQKMGADGFLAKPFDLARLFEVIETTLEGPRT